MKKIFYRIDSLGRTRVWKIEVEKISDSLSIIRTYDGIEGGKMKGSETPITTGLNIGRSNETTVYEQAVKDAQSVIASQIKQGYGVDKNNMKTKGETATIKEPMKGVTFHKTGINNDGTIRDKIYTLDGPIRIKVKQKFANLTEKEIKKLPHDIEHFNVTREGIVYNKDGSIKKDTLRGKIIHADTKLDGYRYRIHVNHDGTTFYSSSGDIVIPFPHIADSIHKSFLKIEKYVFEKYGVTEYYLDGEIYRHSFNKDGSNDPFGGFQKVASACLSQVNLDSNTLLLRSKMQFYLFDVCLINCPYSTRLKILEYFFDDINVIKVESTKIVANEQEIENLMSSVLEKGYEGLMLKTLEMPYEFKRSTQMLKYKPLIDSEYKICGFKESITGNTLGSIECVMDDGRTFWAKPMNDFGTDEARKDIWDNQQNYLGKWVTCSYLNLTDDGKPRHPRVKGFRKGKSKD